MQKKKLSYVFDICISSTRSGRMVRDYVMEVSYFLLKLTDAFPLPAPLAKSVMRWKG